jgi:hypothetical protein
MKDENGKFLVYFKGGVANGKIAKNILFCCFSKNGIMDVWGI